MGLVYAPNQPIGKGATSGNIRNFNPRLAGSFSRIGTIVTGFRAGIRFAQRHYKFSTGLGSVATGAGVENLVGQTDNQFRKTYRTDRFQQRGYSNRYNGRSYFRKQKSRQFKASTNRCCCESNIHRTMVPRRRNGYRNKYRYT